MLVSTSRASPRTISDLPVEILRMIFGYVRDCSGQDPIRGHDDDSLLHFRLNRDNSCWGPYEFTPENDIKSIKNVRLTSRLFCAASSDLLISCMEVNISSASLAYVEEISQHSTISKGVQAVRIDLGCMAVVDDLKRWCRDHVKRTFVKGRETGLDLASVLKIRHTFPNRLVKEFNELWNSFVEPKLQNEVHGDGHLHVTDAEPPEANAIWTEYTMLYRRYMEQQQILSSGSLVRSVTTAMTRMPTAVRLYFNDSPRYLDSSPWPHHLLPYGSSFS